MTTPLFFGVQNSILPHKKTIAFRFFKKIIFTILLLSFNQMIWAQDVDLELSMTSNNATPNLYETIRLTYTLTNTGTVVANNIQVRTGICNSSVNSIDGFNQNNQVVNSSPGPSASVGSYSIANRRWTIPQLAAGTSATLEISLFVLSTDEKTLLGEVRAVNEQDVDSTPGNLLTCTTSEDDEASFVINDDGVTPATPNIIVSNVNFDGSPTYRPGDDIAVTYDIAVEDADVPATITRVYLHYFAFGGAEQFVELGNLTTPAMSAGITQTFSPTLSIPTDAAVGEYRLFVKVDETELVAESSEFDNQASPPSVQGVSPRALINYLGLEITNVTCPSEYPQRGGGVTVNYQITLQNNSSQPTFATTLYHYQSEPDRNPYSLPILGQAAVPALAAGEAVTISLSADLITEFPGYNSSGEVVYAELFFSLNPILSLTGEGHRLATQDVFCQKYNTDIELNLSADDLTYGLDDIIDYTITVTNNGSETAYNLFTDIEAFLPIGTLVNSSTSANSEVYRFYDQTGNPTFHFYIPVLGVGESATADITFKIFQLDTPSQLTETVELTVYSGHLIDANESNNTDQLVFDFDDENNECSVTATIENVRCGETGNGTLITIADVTVNGTGNLSLNGYSIPLENGGSTNGNYGETRQLNLGADYVQNALAGQFAITVIDQDDPTCRVDVSEPAPDCTIGETCTLTATIENIRCTSVLGNPLVTADVTVDATGNGSSSGYTLTVDGDNTNNSQTFNYGQTTTISILNTLVQNVLNGNFAFNVTDLDNPSCTMDFSEPAINCAGNDDLIDLELSLSVDNPNPSLYQKIFPTYTLTNNSAQSATNVKVQVGMCSVQNGDFQNEFGFTNVNGFVYSSPSPSASFGSYNSISQIWTLPEMAPGQTATLDLTLFTLSIEERKLLGQVTDVNEMDTDSSPNNLMACDVQEDDEAAQSLNAAFGNCSGFIEITTQSGLNVFNGCTTWDGTIFINGDDITDLSPMNSLEIVTGDLHFRDNINLENLDGLENLRRVDGDNTRFNGLFIINNNQLQNIDGLSSLETVNGGLNVGSNDALTDLDGLNSLTTVEDLKILNLESLNNLNGLNNLQSTNGLEIRELPLITNIDAFSNITTLFSISVADNNNLQDVNGLSNLQQANLLSVADNSSLADCCGIFPILNNNGVSQQAFVQNNLSCNSVQDVLDNCGGGNTCEITDAGVQWTCLLGGAGTEDDLVVLEVEPIGLNLGTSYTVNGPNVDNEVSGYGGLFTLHGFSTSIDAVYTYTITDNDNPDCTIEFTFNPSSASETCPAECSYNSNSTMATAFCDDNDTTDPSDDQWFISVNPTGTDLGSTFSVSSQSPVLNASNLAYGQEHIFGPFEPAQGNIPIYQVDLTITDDDFACSNSSILEIRGACSGGNNGVDLELGLSATNPNPNIFTKTTLTYTLTNTGTATAMNSSVRVGMCSVQNGGFVNGFGFINANGVVYSSPSPNVSTGSYNQSSQIWTVPQLAAGQSATLNVTVFLLTGEERVVLGEVQSMGQADVDSTPGNLSTCTTSEDDEARLALNGNTTELLPDLQLANLNSSATGEPGQIVNYTVDILNTGNTTASGDFEIGAYLSTDNQYQASDVLIGGIGTGNAPIGTQADIPGSVTVPVGANPGNYFLILLIDKDGEITESNENNNTISIPFTVEDGACICPDNYDPVCGSDGMTYGNACEAECAGIFSYTLGECPIGNDGVDLELELIAPANYNIYTTVTFQARVFNNGTVNAENAKVSFPLPDGFVHSSNSASQGSYDLFRERWNIGTIKAGETAVLDLNLFALTSDATTAYAQVSEANPTDVDSTPGNGTCCTPNEDDEAAITISSSFQGGNGTTAHSLQKANRDVEIKTLYPNIATDEMTIFVQSKLPELNMRVYNLQGHEVLQKKYQDTEGFQRLQLNVSELPTGTYLIRFDGALGQETVRFVKMRM